jgi:spore coat polysaccharide biosynthesis predicted glycosyltransferase SpsG
VAAGPRVGFGHLMRARALSSALELDAVLSLRGGRAARAAAELIAPVVDAASALDGADVLVVDDPKAEEGRRWIARARRAGIATVSVHDDAHVHGADLVVCGALGVPVPRVTATLLHGPRYYLLDGRIAGARHLRAAAGDFTRPQIIVALGGGQHVVAVAQRLVDAIVARCPDADIAVAAGFSGRVRPALRKANWLAARTGLTRALLNADVAVVAGGVTLYEACALGVPAVAMAVVREQRRAIRAFAREGAVIDAGFSKRSAAAAAAGVARLLGNPALRAGTVANARRLVDGRGAFRVAQHIHALLQERSRRCA